MSKILSLKNVGVGDELIHYLIVTRSPLPCPGEDMD